ncbi:MAG: AzlC family ABC transporter permease [Eubacterium sp.]
MKISKTATLRYAIKQSLPVLFGYLFLGSAFGIMLYEVGYNWVWAMIISVVVYAGSGQFLLVSLINSCASLPTVAMMTLFINTRHMFYGLSYIEKFKKGGWRYPFTIFTLTDETYSVNSSITTVPDNVDEARARFLIGEFDHLYWILGSVLGSLLSQMIPIDFTGVDFSMTALFVVIFIDLIRGKGIKLKMIGGIGVFCAIICLIIFGPDKFLLPTLGIIVLTLSLGKNYFDTEGEVATND